MTPHELKNSILQLAIQGKLVEQRPEDGTAEELYRQIQAEKQNLIKEGKIKKEKPLSEITEDEIPFDIPESWKWVRWGTISESIQYGYNAPAKENGRIRMVRISDIQDENVLWETVPFCDINDEAIGSYLLCENDILFARTGGTVGKSFLVKEVPYESIYAGYLIRTRYSSLLCPEYMKHFMESQLYWNQLHNGTIATAQPNCNGQTLSKMILPLPPLSEQKRIVVKIEELLPLIDRYEKAWTKLEDFNRRFPADMQKSLLQMAIQGKLVEQRPEEGTGEELYRQIQAEKQKLIKEGKIKKEKPLPEIAEDEKPFDIPDNWKWARLNSITYNLGQKKPNSKFCYIDVGSIDNQKHCLNFNETVVKPESASSRARKIVQYGDVIFATIRPYLQNICIIDREFSFEPIVSTAFAVMTCPVGLYNKYLFYSLLSPTFMEYANANDKAKGVAYPAISEKDFYNGILPLPPLAEQKRIVAKLDELLPLCEKLK